MALVAILQTIGKEIKTEDTNKCKAMMIEKFGQDLTPHRVKYRQLKL
jgi:hypothetical protein